MRPTLLYVTILAELQTVVGAQYAYGALGFGTYGSSGPNFNTYKNASLTPTYQHSWDFQGYNLSDIGPGPANSNATESWQLHLNYTFLSIDNNNVSNIVYSLTFPEPELPITNASDWQLCAHISDTILPANISNIEATDDGNCVPYLGIECHNAYLEELRLSSSSGSTGCPSGPTFGSIPACRAHFGSLNQTVTTAGIMKTTAPDVEYLYNNRTYINSTTGQAIPNPTFRGLQPRDPYAYNTRRLQISTTLADAVADDVSRLLFSALSLTTSKAYRTNTTNSQGQVGGANNVRLFCGRIAKRPTGASQSGAGVMRGDKWLAMAAAAVGALTFVL